MRKNGRANKKSLVCLRRLSYVSSTLEQSRRDWPVTSLAIAFVIDSLICFLLFTGSTVFGVSLHLRIAPKLGAEIVAAPF